MNSLHVRLMLADGFCAFEAKREEIVECHVSWQRGILKDLASVEPKELTGSTVQCFSALLPFVSNVSTRKLLMELSNGWVLFLDNGWRGTDPVYATVLSSKLGCRAVRVTSTLQTLKKDTVSRYGGTILEYHDPTQKIKRSICAVNDGGRWVFEQRGEPLPFENLDDYTQPRIRDRFGRATLFRYLNHLGIEVFDEGWAESDALRHATLIETQDTNRAVRRNEYGTEILDVKQFPPIKYPAP